MEPASKRSKASAAENDGVLPPDVVWEILLRVTASSLFRFHAVCRSWRSLLSDPSFVKAHAALRPGFILALAGAGDRIDVLDLAGHVVRRINIPPAEEERVLPLPLPAHPGPLYLFRARQRTRVVDPDTGVVSTLPVDHLDAPSPWGRGTSWYAPEPLYTLWRDSSTGHHKVLRVATLDKIARLEQLCDVLTLGGHDDDDDQKCCWRRRPSPPICITSNKGAQGVIIQGFVYFIADKAFPYFITSGARYTRDGRSRAMQMRNYVASFNLETEEWTPAALRGPSAIDTRTPKCKLKLAKLSNSLVMVHFHRAHPDVDLWFATDLEKSLWVKKYSMPTELILPYPQMCIHGNTKLMALDDERIVSSYYDVGFSPNGDRWVTRIYDSTTKACIDVPHQLDVHGIVGVYRGSFSMLGE